MKVSLWKWNSNLNEFPLFLFANSGNAQEEKLAHIYYEGPTI